jgi:hypothetical protein
MSGFWCKVLSAQFAWEDRICDYAATTAVQMAGIVDGRRGSLPTLNCCFLIFAASSIPLIATAAVWNRLNPA